MWIGVSIALTLESDMFRLVPTHNGFLCPEDPGEPGSNDKRWSVNDTEARILSELFKGLDVLEIGTGLGVSTNKIAERARRVHSVDIDPWVKKTVVPTLAKNVIFYESLDKVPSGLDGAFIDGLHSYEQCSQDIRDCRRLVKPGGLIVFHDAKLEPVFYAVRDSGLKATSIITWAGMAMAWNE